MKNYNIQHEKLCKTLQLGDLILEPQELSGGLNMDTDIFFYAR